MHVTPELETPFGAYEIARIRSEEVAIYFIGLIWYKDVFGDTHTTDFKIYVTGKDAMKGHPFAACEDGNNET